MNDTIRVILVVISVLVTFMVGWAFYTDVRITSAEGRDTYRPRLSPEECRTLCAPNPVVELGCYGGGCRCAVPDGFHQ